MLLISEIATDTMKWGKEGNSFRLGILPSCQTGALWNDSAPVLLGRLRPLDLLGWDSQGC